MMFSIVLLALLPLVGGIPVDEAAKTRPLTIEDVARLPLPGTTVPSAIGFAADGKTVSFLLPEQAGGSTRVFWRADASGGNPVVVARPPGGGNADGHVSIEEALRRERQRNRDSGITSLNRASKVDATVFPIAGDLFLQRGTAALERLTETPEPEIDPQLSPDGTQVAYVRGQELRVLNVASRKEMTLSKGATEGLSHGLAEFMAQEEMGRSTGFWWSPDGLRIAYQETDERNVERFTIVHEGTPQPSVETHRYPFSGKANAKVRLGVVAVTGGETTWLSLADEGEEFYLARVNWDGPESLLVQVMPRDQKSLRLERIDLRTGKRTRVIEEKSDQYVNLSDDLRVLPTGEIIWTSERSGFRHIELMKGDGSGRLAITSGEWQVDAIVGVDAARREVWFLSGKEDVVGAQLFRVGLDDGKLAQVTDEKGTHKSVVAPDGEHFVDTYSSVTKPPVTTLRDRAGKVLAVLDDASKDPRISEFALPRPELVTFASRDGVSLRGAFYAPLGRAAGEKAPLVVMLYGGPHVQYVPDAWSLTADLRAQYLAQRGFAVWKMDNRGSARRGFAFESAIHRKMGTVEVQDQADGVKFVGERWKDVVDLSRVGVNGRSYGGFMTLRCLTEAPDVFHAGVAEAPVTDWDGYDTCYTERYMGTPQNNVYGYLGSSLLNKAGLIRGKLLIMHGLIDENVHFRHTARLVGSMIQAGTGFEVFPVPEERHSSRDPKNRQAEAGRLMNFFEATLGR